MGLYNIDTLIAPGDFYQTQHLLLEMEVFLSNSSSNASSIIVSDDGPDAEESVQSILESPFNIPSLLYQYFEDVIVSDCCVPATFDSPIFRYGPHTCTYPLKDQNYTFLYRKGALEYAIGFCHKFTHVYGHLLLDYFPLLLGLPEVLFQKATFLLPMKKHYIMKYLGILDIKPHQVICINPSEYLFVRHYVHYYPVNCGHPNLLAIRRLRDFFWRKYKTTDSKPFRYVLLLRERKTNFTDPILILKKMFPEIEWEIYPDYKSVKEVVNYFFETALLWTVHGSNQANAGFMQEGTVLCDIHLKDYVVFYYTPLVALGVSIVMVKDQKLDREVVSDYPIPMHQVRTQIEVSLKILERNKLR